MIIQTAIGTDIIAEHDFLKVPKLKKTHSHKHTQ